jgi:pyrimidine operon attenuation protein/uracil phosphoribosyltransferase
MSENTENGPETTVVLDADGIRDVVHRMAQEIVAETEDLPRTALLGVLSRGRPLAERLAKEIERISDVRLKVGSLSTRLYRDDLRSGKAGGIMGATGTHFDFDVNDVLVIIVDDVLGTGRTARAALDEIMDYGRPRRIQLACLVDRGLRELPIQADYCGWSLSTRREDHVRVLLRETDDQDAVLLERGDAKPQPAGPDAEGEQ